MRIVILSIALTLLVSSGFAQENNVAPINWEMYSVPSEKVSVAFPKLPTKLASYDGCAERMHDIYRAYADGAAYELTIFTNRKIGPRPKWCKEVRDPYDSDALKERLNEIAVQKQANPPERFRLAGLDAFRFTTANLTRVLVSDLGANDRWVELEVQHYPDKVPDLERFFGSLRLNAATGRDIHSGSMVTLGDEGVTGVSAIPADLPGTPDNSKGGALADKAKAGSGSSGSGSGDAGGSKPSNSPAGPSYRIVVNERPAYTETARRKGVQGTVTLRIALLANGSVGSVTVLNGLPDGLTEMAIYAARRIVFLPKRVDGKPVSVVIKLEYGFRVY